MKKNEISVFLAAAGGVVSSLVGGWDRVMQVLLIFMVIDYITGIGSAIRTRCMSSEIGFSGLLKKATIYLVMILATQLDHVVDANNFFRTSTAIFYITNEGISILENVEEIGVPLPNFLKNTLYKLRTKYESDKPPIDCDDTRKEE